MKNVACIYCYVAGLIAGDGTVDFPDSHGHYRARIFDSSRAFLEALSREFNARIGLRPTVYWEGSCWCLEIYGKQVVASFLERLRKPKHELEWLKGFVDAEGSVYLWVRKRDRKYYQISITNSNRQYIEAVTLCLKKLGIAHRARKRRELDKRTNKIYVKYDVLINRKSSIVLFLKLVEFRHPVKSSRVDRLLSPLPPTSRGRTLPTGGVGRLRGRSA